MLPIRHILCPTDFSPPSVYAFGVAEALAHDYGARLTLVHVAFPPPAFVAADIPVPTHPDYEKEHLLHLQDQLEGLSSKHPMVAIERRLEEGDAATEILALAESAEVDLVMGTHGRSGFSRLLMGSVAESVSRKASMPVLLVKAPRQEVKAPQAVTMEEKIREPVSVPN